MDIKQLEKLKINRMKKLMSLFAIAALGLTTAFAQTPAASTQAKPAAKKETKAAKTATTTKTAKVTPPPPPVEPAGAKLKADGTPDKRYKENKGKTVSKVAAGPTKKDGTPDMRYKANKDAAKKN